jgi:hypothetical protein
MTDTRHLLLVAHCPSDNTRALRDAVIRGASHEDIDNVELRSLAPLDAGPEDVRWADGIIIGTTENFGYMAGRIKDFFERVYYPCLEEKQGMPWALYIRAGLDGQGTKTAVERIVTGLRWNPIRETLICRGEFDDAFLDQCEELGMTMAAGLEAGLF